MSLSLILITGVILSIIFHFIGVYAGAKKFVWLAIAIFWAGSINIAMSEVKPTAYKYIDKIKGKYEATDKLIESSLPEISVYELIQIKKSFNEEKKKAQK